MFNKTFQATHPSMIDGIDNQTLCELYRIGDLFVADEISLNYTHNERMVIGGAGHLPAQVTGMAEPGTVSAARGPTCRHPSGFRLPRGSRD